MNQVDQNINKVMIDFDLIDVESLDLTDNQTWLYKIPGDSGHRLDVVDWNLSCDWPVNEDEEYHRTVKDLNSLLDNILKNDFVATPDKHKFDSRTYVKPKKRVQRPSIQSIVEVTSNPPSLTTNSYANTCTNTYANPPSLTPNPYANQSANKYLTYNKYSAPLGPINPMLRLKTFNVDVHTDNSSAVKDYAARRRGMQHDEDPQLENPETTSEKPGHLPSKPINIDLSQPAHNLHNTFNKGLTNILNERGSLNMYQSGESLMRMSPPSLVSSLLMETSGTFNTENIDGKKSVTSHRDSGLRESLDPMMTSMTLSILDEKDMSTSFLSQTTNPDNDSLMDSLPPSLVSSVNSSYVVSNTSKPRESTDANIFSSTTFTHLEQSERLLSARPRCQLYNSFKRESIRNSESYTKSREEASQIDTPKVLNENTEKNNTPKSSKPDMSETITLHYANNKFLKDTAAEKENLNSTFEKDDAFYNDNGIPKPVDLGKNSLNVTLDKQELNEIIQARQKLSLARKALPSQSDTQSQDKSTIKTIQLPNQTITVPKHSMENASELLSKRRRDCPNGFETQETREIPKRNATFKKLSPKANSMDATVVYVKTEDSQMIDINSATLNLIDSGDKTLQSEEWGSQERAMVGSSESTDTGTFSSSSPPESVPHCVTASNDPRSQISTPLAALRKSAQDELLNLHSTISPIYDGIDDKSYTLTKAASSNSSNLERTFELSNTTVVNTGTFVKKDSVKRDILAGRVSPEKKGSVATVNKASTNRIMPTNTVSYGSMAPPSGVQRKSGLPTSKLRQYSSHKELSRLPGSQASTSASRPMVRRGVYASHPALSPDAPPANTIHPAQSTHLMPAHAQPRRESEKINSTSKTLVNPPALVRQGTETLRRDRPQSQLLAPKDVRMGCGLPVSMRNHQGPPPPPSRPYSVAGASQLRVSRPTTVPLQKPVPAVPVSAEPRPASSSDSRVSALPRPTRLPAPRRTLRPPSVYSVAPTAADMDHY